MHVWMLTQTLGVIYLVILTNNAIIPKEILKILGWLVCRKHYISNEELIEQLKICSEIFDIVASSYFNRLLNCYYSSRDKNYWRLINWTRETSRFSCFLRLVWMSTAVSLQPLGFLKNGKNCNNLQNVSYLTITYKCHFLMIIVVLNRAKVGLPRKA